jgi:rod shape-determining protein MreD
VKSFYFSTRLLIFLSFFAALLLNIIPLSPLVALFYPLWLPLILIYWVIVLPEHIHLSLAWILGLLIDVLHGNYLGEHALALSVLAFLSYRFHLQFRMFPLTQQILFVLMLLIIYQGLFFWMQVFLGFAINFHCMWFSLLASLMMWPLLKSVLRAPL